MPISKKQAYEKGWRSQRTSVDWDEAVTRFARKYEPGLMFGPLQHAWADGWSDHQEDRPKGHALTCPGAPGDDPMDHGRCII